MAVYGLEVPAGDIAIAAKPDIPAAVSKKSRSSHSLQSYVSQLSCNTKIVYADLLQFRITMAALDPSAEPEEDGPTKTSKPRATLKIIREPLLMDMEDEDDSDFDEDEMNALLAEEDDDESEDENVTGGPSDPAKSKKARKAAAAEQLRKELQDNMEVDAENGMRLERTGNVSVADEDKDDEDEDDEDDEDFDEPEEFVLCTLDPEQVCLTFEDFSRLR